MKVSPFSSLRFRLIASVVIIEIVMLSIMVWNNVDSIYRTHTDRLNDTANSLLQQFAKTAGEKMAEVDYAGLEENAISILNHSEVAYLTVLGLNFQPIIQLGIDVDDQLPVPDNHPTDVTDGIFDVATDIKLAGRLQGRVLMGFSLATMQAAISEARNRSIAIAATEIVLSVIVTVLLGISLTRSLRSLSDAAARVGRGNYDTQLPVTRNDEVGLTAQAFNKMVSDIADRTRRIEEGQDQVRLLMDSTAEAIVGVNNDARCMFVNQACLRMLGYQDVNQIIGKDFHELAHHTHTDGRPYPGEQCTIRLGARTQDTFHTDKETFWRADGTSFPIEAWTYPIRRDGNKVGYMVTFIDITERKQAEAAVERLNKQVHLLLESTGEGIFGVDQNLCCTFLNRAAAEILGYQPHEMQGQDMHALVHGFHEDGTPYPREETLIYRTIRENRSFQSDTEGLWTKKGDCIPAQYSSSPITEGGVVTGAAVVFRNVTEARAMARKMDYLATHDPLTGLVNRHEFEARLERTLEDARRENSEHVLCYLDLDQFKVVNDTCGHVAGDELLRQLTTLLQDKIRQDDTLARLGGDEFGVLMGHCSLQHGSKVIDEICQMVRDFRFVWEDKAFTIGVSIGVTDITMDTPSIGKALSEADAACYIAKDSGRNRVHIYKVDDAALAERHGEMQWVSRIHNALEQNRLTLFYQLIVPVDKSRESSSQTTGDFLKYRLRKRLPWSSYHSHIDGNGSHFEVLLRMRDENGDFLPPGAFIPAAERYNQMPEIDRWVVKNTFDWLQRNKEYLEKMQLCTINLSGHTLSDKNFFSFVIDKLHSMDIPGEKICFEITETAAVANLTQAIKFMRLLKARGCRFALDDFGSGMSSFAYLKNLPVDYLKIDGNFVRNIVEDQIDYSMVEAINQVGHVMGIKTIAEFVENEQILEELKRVGVDYVQGFGLARPKPLEELIPNEPVTAGQIPVH